MYKKFDELGVQLSKPVLKTLEQLNFTHATPIQVCTLNDDKTFYAILMHEIFIHRLNVYHI